MDQNLLNHLQKHQINYEVYEHPAVFTVEESKQVDRQIPGLHTKNLFLREKGGGYYLVCLPADKRLDIKSLSQVLGTKKLSFASAEELKEYLNLTPGSVSVFGMIYTSSVQLVLDKEILRDQQVGFHPNINTATLVLNQANLSRFLETLSGPKYISVQV
jgi:Ala-tRNA(Pro) deacylase